MIVKCIKVGNYYIDIIANSLYYNKEDDKIAEFDHGAIIYDEYLSLTDCANISIEIYKYIVSLRCHKITMHLEKLAISEQHEESFFLATDAVIWLMKKNNEEPIRKFDIRDVFSEITQILTIEIHDMSSCYISNKYKIFKDALIDIILFCNIKDIYLSIDELDPDIENASKRICVDMLGEFSVKEIAAIEPSCYFLEKNDISIIFNDKNIRLCILS